VRVWQQRQLGHVGDAATVQATAATPHNANTNRQSFVIRDALMGKPYCQR
jgi:hypothetical protein